MASHPKFDLTKTSNGQFKFDLTAANGQTILTSETYTAKAGATNGIDSVRENSPKEARYDKKQAKNGQYYFNLLAANGQVIGTSEMYTSTGGRDNGIESVMTNGPKAETEDNT